MLELLEPSVLHRRLDPRSGTARAEAPVADDAQSLDGELGPESSRPDRLNPNVMHAGIVAGVATIADALREVELVVERLADPEVRTGIGDELHTLASSVHTALSAIAQELGLETTPAEPATPAEPTASDEPSSTPDPPATAEPASSAAEPPVDPSPAPAASPVDPPA